MEELNQTFEGLKGSQHPEVDSTPCSPCPGTEKENIADTTYLSMYYICTHADEPQKSCSEEDVPRLTCSGTRPCRYQSIKDFASWRRGSGGIEAHSVPSAKGCGTSGVRGLLSCLSACSLCRVSCQLLLVSMFFFCCTTHVLVLNQDATRRVDRYRVGHVHVHTECYRDMFGTEAQCRAARMEAPRSARHQLRITEYKELSWERTTRSQKVAVQSMGAGRVYSGVAPNGKVDIEVDSSPNQDKQILGLLRTAQRITVRSLKNGQKLSTE